MKILGNSSRGLTPSQKRHLYICCSLPIVLYRFQLWYYNKTHFDYFLHILRKMQWRVALWIYGAFQTSPTAGVEAILGLIPIYLQLKKLYERFHLRGFLFSSNYIFKLIINTEKSSDYQCISLNNLIAKQKFWLHSPLIDMDKRCNKFLPVFSLFDIKFSLGNRLIDSF